MKKNLLFFSIFFLILLLTAPVLAQSQQTLSLKTGYNFKSFTVVPSITPQQLIVQYPSIEDIYLYHAYSGGFISVNEGTLTAFGPAKGYVFKCRQDLSLTLSGAAPGACGQITLMPEYNLAGFSKMPETITCSQLMARYSGIKGIYKWSADAGLFIQVVRDISGNVVLIDGVDPELAAGESYFFNMQGQCDLSYDLSQITLAGEGVSPSTIISNVSAVNGALTVYFTGAPLPLSLSNSDIAVNRSVNSAPFVSVTPVSLNRVADYTLEISLQPVSSLSDIDQTVMYRVSYMNSATVNASVFTVLKGTGSKVAKPVFSVPGGSYNSMQILTLSCPTPDAEIYCSIDGSEPVPYYGYKYYPGVFGPFVLLNNKTIKAIAVKRGMDNSDVVTAVYTMDIPPAVELVNIHGEWQTTCQLLDAANGLQPLCTESLNYESKLIFNLTEGDIVPLIVWKRNGKVVKLRLLQKMPKASEISAQGIVKINFSANYGNLWFTNYTADALVALEKNLTSNSLQINSNYEVVNISSDFTYLSGTDVQLRDSIGNAVNTLNEIFNSNYISPEVKELIQPSFDFTATGFLNSFLTAVKHPQVKMFLDSNNLPRTVTVNSLVINTRRLPYPPICLLTS